MSAALKLVMENIARLSADERALLAHCLIASLEAEPDDGVDQAWGELAEQRLSELESGAVQAVSWDEIRNNISRP